MFRGTSPSQAELRLQQMAASCFVLFHTFQFYQRANVRVFLPELGLESLSR